MKPAPPYSALPNEIISSRVCSSSCRTREGNSAEQFQAVRVCDTAIGPSRDSRLNDHRRSGARPGILVPVKAPVLVLTVTHREFVVSKIMMIDLPVLNPWTRISSVHYYLVMKSSQMNTGRLSEVLIKSHYCRPLLNWTALPPPLLHYLSSRPYLATIPCLLATLRSTSVDTASGHPAPRYCVPSFALLKRLPALCVLYFVCYHEFSRDGCRLH